MHTAMQRRRKIAAGRGAVPGRSGHRRAAGGGFQSGVDSRKKCGIIKIERALPVSGQPRSRKRRPEFRFP